MNDPTTVDLYEVLGVPEDASEERIREAVRSQRKIWVLRQNAPSLETRQDAERQLANIGEAASILLDRTARARYDQELKAQSVVAPPPQPPPEADDWVAEATEALNLGDYSRAAWAAREATHLHPRNAEAWAVRARAHLAQEKLNDATHEFRRARDLDPQVGERHFEFGHVLHVDGQWEQARASYNEAVRLVPNEPHYRLAIGLTWVDAGRADAGLEVLEPLAQQHPQDDWIQGSLAYALSEAGISCLELMPDGNAYPTTKEGAENSLALWRRAQALTFEDDILREQLAERIQQSEWALKQTWSMSDKTVLTLLFFSVIIVLCFAGLHPVLGWLSLFGCIAGIVALGFDPNYQVMARNLESEFGRDG